MTDTQSEMSSVAEDQPMNKHKQDSSANLNDAVSSTPNSSTLQNGVHINIDNANVFSTQPNRQPYSSRVGAPNVSSFQRGYQYNSAYPMSVGGLTPMMTSGTPVMASNQIRFGSTRASIASSYQGVTTHQSVHQGGQRILSERVIEHEVKVPKKVIREDIVEKVVIIPEKIVHEEFLEEKQMIREKIIEVATPVIQERIVEVPEIEYIEKIVEVPELILQEKIREVPRIEIQERIIEVPRVITQERMVEVPEIEYREYPVEKIVEVPEVIEQVVIKEIPIPQYVDKPVPEYVDVQIEQEVNRVIPVPVEAVTTCHFTLPRLRPQYTNVEVPLYVPRFIEVPIPVDAMDGQTVMQAEQYAQQVAMLATSNAFSLCEVENIAGTIKQADFASVLAKRDYSTLLTQHWQAGRLQINPASLYYTATTSATQIAVETEVHTSTTVAMSTAKYQSGAGAALEAAASVSEKADGAGSVSEKEDDGENKDATEDAGSDSEKGDDTASVSEKAEDALSASEKAEESEIKDATEDAEEEE